MYIVCVRNMMFTLQEIAFSFDYSTKRLLIFSEELSENQTVQEHPLRNEMVK